MVIFFFGVPKMLILTDYFENRKTLIGQYYAYLLTHFKAEFKKKTTTFPEENSVWKNWKSSRLYIDLRMDYVDIFYSKIAFLLKSHTAFICGSDSQSFS